MPSRNVPLVTSLDSCLKINKKIWFETKSDQQNQETSEDLNILTCMLPINLFPPALSIARNFHQLMTIQITTSDNYLITTIFAESWYPTFTVWAKNNFLYLSVQVIFFWSYKHFYYLFQTFTQLKTDLCILLDSHNISL